LQSQV